jgi:hypothetical protein
MKKNIFGSGKKIEDLLQEIAKETSKSNKKETRKFTKLKRSLREIYK